jgi:hypothetical protein
MSERAPPMNLNTIDEVDNEHDLTMEFERQKFAVPDSLGGNNRKERAATFKPLNYNKDNEKEESYELRESAKNISDPRATESDKNLPNIVKDRTLPTNPTQMHAEKESGYLV